MKIWWCICQQLLKEKLLKFDKNKTSWNVLRFVIRQTSYIFCDIKDSRWKKIVKYEKCIATGSKMLIRSQIGVASYLNHAYFDIKY